jgi:hypothetical protein
MKTFSVCQADIAYDKISKFVFMIAKKDYCDSLNIPFRNKGLL